MTVRELVAAYHEAHDLVTLKGEPNPDLFIIPILLDSIRTIAQERLMKMAHKGDERQYAKSIFQRSRQLCRREYWNMDIEIADTLNDYINGIQDNLDWKSLALYRTFYNSFDYISSDADRELMSWCLVVNTLANLALIARRRMYVKTNNDTINADNQNIERIMDGIGVAAVNLSVSRERKYTPGALSYENEIKSACHELLDFLCSFTKESMDVEIKESR